jgi:Family of unknown function (DUF5686)/CarboxypepD_reg-like domain
MRKKTLLFLLLFSTITFAQLSGKVTDTKGNPLPFVSVLLANTYIGTTTNEQGNYILKSKTPTKSVVVFQYLGYKTKKEIIDFEVKDQKLDLQLEEENIELNEVVITSKIDVATQIIKNAIASKKENSEKTNRFNADFYSRGIIRIKDAPKKIMGQKFDAFDDILDSTRTGIIYLSETVSKITFQKPDKLKETIIASKVSGKDNGFSFNNAASVNYDFYDNYIPFNKNMISPIADNALGYYKYQLEGTFFDDNKQQINKIKVTPKRVSEPALEGYLYIAEDSWAIYAVDLSIKGSQLDTPAIDFIEIKQSFNYNSESKIWIKNTQTIDFVFGFFTIKANGRFTYVYNNFEFPSSFEKKTFTAAILKFEKNANKKDDDFWNKIRPVPLTIEESTDYIKKEILQTKKKSQKYLDSIDAKHNKFGFSDLLMGYSHNNSFHKKYFNYDGFIKGLNFNTVQGWKLNTGFSFTKTNEENRTFSKLKTNIDYGLSEKKLRATIGYTNKFNNQNQSQIKFLTGTNAAQFNDESPISSVFNSLSSLFSKRNILKLYERNFAEATYGQEVSNGIILNVKVDYSERKPLFNTTNYSFFSKDKIYRSNNPILLYDTINPVIQKHNLIKTTLTTQINFGQEYWLRPDGKFNIRNEKYPTLLLSIQNAFGGTNNKYNFQKLSSQILYNQAFGNKGVTYTNLKIGKFFNARNIAFVDYKHFDGNESSLAAVNQYTDTYNLLPYYTASTNDSYLEFHAEHDDKGFITNKIPLLNKLKTNMILGYHNLSIPNRKPYHEFSIGLDNLGFGKFKMFRLDYFRSYQNGFQGEVLLFGFKFLNFLQE